MICKDYNREICYGCLHAGVHDEMLVCTNKPWHFDCCPCTPAVVFTFREDIRKILEFV